MPGLVPGIHVFAPHEDVDGRDKPGHDPQNALRRMGPRVRENDRRSIRMLTMIGKRLLFAIPSLIGVVIVTFLLTRALPGDPAAYFAGPAATKDAVEQVRKKLGLDKPLVEQFFRYTVDLAHGDLGNSLTTG